MTRIIRDHRQFLANQYRHYREIRDKKIRLPRSIRKMIKKGVVERDGKKVRMRRKYQYQNDKSARISWISLKRISANDESM